MDPTLYALISFGLVVGITCISGMILLFLYWSPVEQQRIQTPQTTIFNGTILRWEYKSRSQWHKQGERLRRIFVPHDRKKLTRLRERLS
jgi:hypothetical protein